MAARNRVGLSENTRKRIKTTMLVKRLQKHVLGEVDLSTAQVKSIEVLLRKTLPDLSPISLQELYEMQEVAQGEGSSQTEITFNVSPAKSDVVVTVGTKQNGSNTS